MVNQGHRHYVSSFEHGHPVFTFDLSKARFLEEYPARELARVVGREFDDVRVLYVPVFARRELGVFDGLLDAWTVNYER